MIFYGWKDRLLHLLSIQSDKYQNYHSCQNIWPSTPRNKMSDIENVLDEWCRNSLPSWARTEA